MAALRGCLGRGCLVREFAGETQRAKRPWSARESRVVELPGDSKKLHGARSAKSQPKGILPNSLLAPQSFRERRCTSQKGPNHTCEPVAQLFAGSPQTCPSPRYAAPKSLRHLLLRHRRGQVQGSTDPTSDFAFPVGERTWTVRSGISGRHAGGRLCNTSREYATNKYTTALETFAGLFREHWSIEDARRSRCPRGELFENRSGVYWV